MANPEFNKIEVGNELEKTELDVISNLRLEAFNNENTTEINELKKVLRTTPINVITSGKDAATKTTEAKTLSEIATAFSTYVDKKEGW